MAITGNKGGLFNGTYPQYATPYLFWSYEQSIPNANSTLTATLKVKRNKTGSSTYKASTPYSITISGTKTSGTMSFKITNVSAGEYITIGTATKTIEHDKTTGVAPLVNISATIDLSGTTLGTGTVSTSVTPNTIPRYGTCEQVFGSKSETAIGMGWSSDSVVDYIWYSKDNGATWTGLDVTDGTSGSYTITGLSPNTTYNIKTRIRRKDSQLTTDSSSLSVTTYAYPYITKVETQNLVIGDIQKITLYNPLSRSVTIKMYKDSVKGTQLYSGTTESEVILFIPTASTLYDSIPSNQSAKCVYSVVYGTLTTHTTTGAYTYKIKGTEIPSFSNFTYKDTNGTVSTVLGSDQYLVKGLSKLQVTISSANKMVAQNSASPKNYVTTIDTLNKSANYSTSDLTIDVGTPINAGTKRLTVTAYDTRTLPKAVYKDVVIFDYAKPVINVDIKRLNNFEAETTLKVNGSYSRIIINNADKNSVTKVQYRYRETGGTWSSWATLNTTITSGKFTCSDVVLSLDNNKSFEFQVQAVDKLGTNSLDAPLDVGQAIFFISSNKKQCYINGELVKGSLEVSATQPTNNEKLWIQKGKNLFNIKNIPNTDVITNNNDGTLTFSNNGSNVGYAETGIKLKSVFNGTVGNTYIANFENTFSMSDRNYRFYLLGANLYINKNTPFVLTQIMLDSTIILYGGYKEISTMSNIQIEQGSTATEYEEFIYPNIYTGNNGSYEKLITENDVAVSPTQPSIEKVWIQKGKNLFNKKSEIVLGSFISGDGSIGTDTALFYQSTYIPVSPNTTYTIRSGSGEYHRIAEYDNNKTFIKRNLDTGDTTTFSIITSSNCYFLRISCNISNLDNIQLEQGSATEYEAYVDKKINVNGEEFLDVEKANSQQNYSTAEQVIGTWIDGKSIYRKVTTLPTTWVTGVNTFNTGISNMDTLINSQIYFRYSSTYNIWYSNYDQYQNKRYLNGGSSYELTLGNGITVEEAYLITEYTKT